MNKEDIEMTSACRIVQNMFGSAGCKDPYNCCYCRFREFSEAHRRVTEWIKAAQAIIGCLLTWGDENDSEIAVDHPEVYDLIVKARVLERAGSQAHASCAHMQTLCTHEPANEPAKDDPRDVQIRELFDRVITLEHRLDAKCPSLDVKSPTTQQRCPRLNVPCELLGVCENTALPENIGVCRAQARGVSKR